MSRIFAQSYRILKETHEPFEKGLCMGFLAGFVGLLVHAVGANTFIIVPSIFRALRAVTTFNDIIYNPLNYIN